MKKRGQAGIMLLETLIGLLIFAIGVLGLLGMQATAMKVTADSKYRAEATMYADQLINQMWADKRNNADLVANYATGGPKYDEWYDAISASGSGLPGADQAANQPTVEIDANNNVTISIYWQAPGEAGRHQYITVATVTN